MDNLLNHLRPTTLAQLIAELITDHADEMDDGEFNFHTETAKNAYTQLLNAGCRHVGDDKFFDLIETAVAAEFAREK